MFLVKIDGKIVLFEPWVSFYHEFHFTQKIEFKYKIKMANIVLTRPLGCFY